MRTFDGVDVWIKPTKFVFSVSVFALTIAWFFGYVRPDRRNTPSLRAIAPVIIAAGSFEIIYISWRERQVTGLASHFNISNIFFAVMYGLMGLGALSLVAITLPQAWEIGRRPAAGLRSDYVAAVVIGHVLCCVLGGGFGIYMGQQPGHSVGAAEGHSLIFGWNRAGGDLRIPHFLGIHAQLAIPILGLLVGGLAPRLRWPALIGGSAARSARGCVVRSSLRGSACLPNAL